MKGRRICGGFFFLQSVRVSLSVLAVIPARYGSTRLPGKPLLAETGRPLIQHVYERVRAASEIDRVVVATDDERIAAAVVGFSGEAVMTSPDHATGAERVAEAAAGVQADVVLNVQGDEPEIEPAHLDRLARLQKETGAFASTLACPFPAEAVSGHGSPLDPSCVKVVAAKLKDGAGQALYFSRSLIPYTQGAEENCARPQDWLMHIGVYAFSPASLAGFAAAPASRLEKAERLEQLRILEMGETIAVAIVDGARPGVDTAEDYAAFVARWRAGEVS